MTQKNGETKMKPNWRRRGFWVAVVYICIVVIGLAVGEIYSIGWGFPGHRSEVSQLNHTLEAKTARISELEEYIKIQSAHIKDLETAMNFEKLFLMLCKPQTIMLLEKLQDRLDDKAEFCLSGEK